LWHQLNVAIAEFWLSLLIKVNDYAIFVLALVIDFGFSFTYNEHMSKNATNTKEAK
jgi:hypothetical protein